MPTELGVETEEWRRIPRTHYEASTLGRFRRIGRDRTLRPTVSERGYSMIRMRIDGRTVKMPVAKAVGIAWYGEAERGYAWRLIDPGEPATLSNIETVPEWTQRSVAHGHRRSSAPAELRYIPNDSSESGPPRDIGRERARDAWVRREFASALVRRIDRCEHPVDPQEIAMLMNDTYGRRDDFRLSTLQRAARAVGAEIVMEIR